MGVKGLTSVVCVCVQEKECMEKRLDDNDIYLRSLQEKIKTLINEKDALTGKNKALEEEKELFKVSSQPHYHPRLPQDTAVLSPTATT